MSRRNPGFTLKGAKFHTHWLNLLMGVLLVVCGGSAMNYRDWHTGVFTGWSWFGFIMLAIGAAFVGGLIVLAKKDRHMWPVFVASAISLGLGVGGVLFFKNAHIEWKGALAGLLLFVVIGGLLAGLALTTWTPNRVRVAPVPLDDRLSHVVTPASHRGFSPSARRHGATDFEDSSAEGVGS